MQNAISNTQTANIRYLKDGRTDAFLRVDNPYEMCAFMRNKIMSSKMKYKDIASKAGVCTQTVSRLATNETKDPHIRTVIAILMAMGVGLYVK